jgi:uncharacterized membrane protein HdeD (DUF308 family)
MGLDIRWPIGLMFTLIGAIMVVYGIATGSDTEMYKHSLGTNINLIWGVVQVVFGVWMLFMAWNGAKQPPTEENKKK